MFLRVMAILELIALIDVTPTYSISLRILLARSENSIRKCWSVDLNEVELPWIHEIIAWTAMSKRDLTLAEIEVAILLSGRTNTKSTKARVINIENTLNKCATILRISETPTTKVKTISLIHDSFKQFITNPDLGIPMMHCHPHRLRLHLPTVRRK
jgi:hypothetical protein